MAGWYVCRTQGAQVHGPYTIEQLRQGIAQGKLPDSHFVFCEGYTNGWQTVAEIFGPHAVEVGPANSQPVVEPPIASPTVEHVGEKIPSGGFPSINAGDSPTNRHRRLRQPPRTGQWLLILLDIKFQYYLTPWIIRAAWLLTLLYAALSLSLTTIFVLMPSEPSAFAGRPGVGFDRFPVADEAPVEAKNREPWLADETTAWIRRFAWKAALWLLGAWLLIMWILAVRVICEVMIVIFNIAESLAAIDRNTAKR